jgi:hypothetical protein
MVEKKWSPLFGRKVRFKTPKIVKIQNLSEIPPPFQATIQLELAKIIQQLNK